MFKWVSVTFNVQTLRREGCLVEICRALRSAHFIGQQSTRNRTEPAEDSPVYTTKADKFSVYRFPWRQGSLFPCKHSEAAIAIRESTFLPANVRRIYTPPEPLAGRGGALKMVRGDAAFLIMSLHLPPSPSNLREKQLSEKIWKSARRVLDETPSRVVPVLLDANGHISQNTWPEQIGKHSSKKNTIQWPVLGRTLAGPPFASGEHILPSWSDFLWTLHQYSDRLRVPSGCYFHVHRCCALHHDGGRLQPAAAPRKNGSSPHSVCLSASAYYMRNTRKRQDHQWYKNKLTQGALFAQDRTTFLARVEEACGHDEEWTGLTVTDFWAKLNQVVVDAGADLYARETKAKISTPQDTLDARHDLTKAKLESNEITSSSSQKSDARLGPFFGHRERCDTSSQDGGLTRHTGGRQQQCVDHRGETRQRARIAHLRRVGST